MASFSSSGAAEACPVCDGLTVVRYAPGALPASRPFCSGCHRRLEAVEIEGDERRRLAAAAGASPRE